MRGSRSVSFSAVSDPLGLLPLAHRRRRRRIVDGYEAQQLVAAGLTLLQRSAPLVRALQRRRSAILLPTSPAFFTALAAIRRPRRGARQSARVAAPRSRIRSPDANVGAVFTNAALAHRAPDGVAARAARRRAAHRRASITGGASHDVDLGSHHGLTLEGERDVRGRDEEAAIVYTSAMRGYATRRRAHPREHAVERALHGRGGWR